MTKPARDLPVGVYCRPDLGSSKYSASISRWTPTGKIQKHLGTFDTVAEAAEARRKGEEEFAANKEKHHD